MLRSLKQNLTRFIGYVTYFGTLDVPISPHIFDSINIQTWIIQNVIVRRNDNEKIIDLVASCVIQVDKLVSFLPSIIPQCIYSHDCLEIRLQACPRKNNELIPKRHLQKKYKCYNKQFCKGLQPICIFLYKLWSKTAKSTFVQNTRYISQWCVYRIGLSTLLIKNQDKWKMDHDKNYNFFEVENTLILDLFMNLLLLQQDKQYQEKFHWFQIDYFSSPFLMSINNI